MIKKIIKVLLCLIAINCAAKTHHPQKFLDKISGERNEGHLIVEHYCAACHAENPLINIGAPRIANVSDWKNRLTKGIDILFANTDKGINAMPARGGCFECSDTQLMQAIQALLPQKKP